MGTDLRQCIVIVTLYYVPVLCTPGSHIILILNQSLPYLINENTRVESHTYISFVRRWFDSTDTRAPDLPRWEAVLCRFGTGPVYMYVHMYTYIHICKFVHIYIYHGCDENGKDYA